jgi:CheY-like chemotaxis protein
MAKILLVEDNEINRVMLTRRLQRLGYLVVLANDGEQGRDLTFREQPNLIIMDVGLPGIDGLEATRLLKANEQTRQIPIIVLTRAHPGRVSRKGIDSGLRRIRDEASRIYQTQ